MLPEKVSVPAPCFVTAPVPLMMPEYVEASERLKMSVPLLMRSVARTPPVVPVPTWSVPPEFRLIVPLPPCDSVPPTVTRPLPEMFSVPVPLRPTVRLPLLAHVPLATVAVPTLPTS